LECATDFTAGDRVRLELELSPAPKDRIVGLGSIVDSSGTAIRFDVIREADRDRIVQYTLAVERARVRPARSATA
jgi:hypothetical protein